MKAIKDGAKSYSKDGDSPLRLRARHTRAQQPPEGRATRPVMMEMKERMSAKSEASREALT
jgi:hypothetical protein